MTIMSDLDKCVFASRYLAVQPGPKKIFHDQANRVKLAELLHSFARAG